ncbi:methyltransferase domain-containing protein (plasmid) [Embleya sp. NBC_00888]|uniref:methyltransferase domain-containing protein n=1 Tax=Embleya sp. NBC_00888 TaxID=2975960 RepID=UPI002F918A5F|nr:methyltransferase domain-containing protein [Embleya sp. NBC_00888]
MTAPDGIARFLADVDALPDGWKGAFEGVDRADFAPDRIWAWDGSQYTTVIDRTQTGSHGRDTWDEAVQGNNALVTQWDDGNHTGDEPGNNPSSSASMPSAVASMLGDLDITGGENVLEVGTGTGYTAALLAARGCRVTTIELDTDLAEQARKNLAQAGHQDVIVVTGDGTLGHSEHGPYDRVHVTAGVRHTPAAWIEQTRPGGVIVMPWGTDYSTYDWTAALTVTDPGRASGPFTTPLAFMKLRSQRARYPKSPFPSDWTATARMSEPDIDITDITGALYEPAEFVIGLHVPHCVPRLVHGAESTNLWLYGADTGRGPSIAVAAFGDGYDPQAREAGPRHLWAEVQAAYHRWDDAGKPNTDRFGLTVTVDEDGRVEQRPWYETPDRELPFRH